MKLQKEELAAVANYVLEEIKKKNTVELKASEKKEIQKFISEYDKLTKEIADLNKKRSDLYNSFGKKHNLGNYFTVHSQLETLIRDKKQTSIPTLHKIREELILKSLFADEKELKQFIKELVEKY